MISVLDTSICSYNIGNDIIMDAVYKEIEDIFPHEHIIRLPATDIKKVARSYSSRSLCSFVGGTNLLSNDMRHNREFNLDIHNAIILRNLVLMGCGWFQYQNDSPTQFTKWALSKILSKHYIHSVRDEYTKQKLSDLGIKALNTGCPTLWRIENQKLSRIPSAPARKVVLTITDYSTDPERDSVLIRMCRDIYKGGIIFFPQGVGDIQYLKDLGLADGVEILSPRLGEYNRILESGQVDYVGTRLHAGIRALQKNVRSFIIGVDNRALEMQRDFALPVLQPKMIEGWQQAIEQNYHVELKLPSENIEIWRNQFV